MPAKHRAPRPVARLRTTVVASTTGPVPLAALGTVAAPGAQGPASVSGDAIAQCESSGNWAANTGNGFFGGLQFTASTWKAFGGSGTAQHASREQQIAAAQRGLAGQGIGAWPVCGKHASSGKSVSSSTSRHSSTQTQTQTPTRHSASTGRTSTPKHAASGDYTVV